MFTFAVVFSGGFALVDTCREVKAVIDEHAEIRKQISVSDTLLINKSDSVDRNYLVELTQMLSEINPLATIVPTIFGESASCNLLDTDAYNASQIEHSTLSFTPHHQHQNHGQPRNH